MSNKFVKIPVDWAEFDPDINIWELNPQLKYYQPYSDLYDSDETEDKIESSIKMWVIFFMRWPDENENLFFRMSEKERKEMISNTFFKDGDWDEPVFKECLNSFPEDCMTAVQRAYAIEIDQLKKRTQLMETTELTLDKTIVTDNNKAINIKGTANQINTLQKDALKVYENYEKIRIKYIDEKEQMDIHGGQLKQIEKDKNFF